MDTTTLLVICTISLIFAAIVMLGLLAVTFAMYRRIASVSELENRVLGLESYYKTLRGKKANETRRSQRETTGSEGLSLEDGLMGLTEEERRLFQ